MSFFNRKSGGLLDAGPVVSLAAAGNAAAVAVYTLPSSANLLGTKSLVIKKVRWNDNGTGGTLLHIGTGVAGAVVDLIPPIRTVTGFDDELELEVESTATIMAYPDAVGGSTIDVQISGEIKG